jgi:Phospholipase D C terminal
VSICLRLGPSLAEVQQSRSSLTVDAERLRLPPAMLTACLLLRFPTQPSSAQDQFDITQVRDTFRWPSSEACIREVHALAAANWRAYVGPVPARLRGHLMLYPVSVSSTGRVTALRGYECIPDAKNAWIVPQPGTGLQLPPLLVT